MASQLFVDLYDCDEKIIDDLESIRKIARDAIQSIGAEIVEECSHKFQPIGVTYIAVISTSHFSIHTWPENRYVAVDIFSCKEELPELLAEQLKLAFHAGYVKIRHIERKIEREIEREIEGENCNKERKEGLT